MSGKRVVGFRFYSDYIRLQGKVGLANLQLLQLERDKNISLMYCHDLFFTTQNGSCSVYGSVYN